MEILKYLLLAVVQGLTETIPVSSSGHLMIIKKLISLDDTVDKKKKPKIQNMYEE